MYGYAAGFPSCNTWLWMLDQRGRGCHWIVLLKQQSNMRWSKTRLLSGTTEAEAWIFWAYNTKVWAIGEDNSTIWEIKSMGAQFNVLCGFDTHFSSFSSLPQPALLLLLLPILSASYFEITQAISSNKQFIVILSCNTLFYYHHHELHKYSYMTLFMPKVLCHYVTLNPAW